jgi:hypothetical protein
MKRSLILLTDLLSWAGSDGNKPLSNDEKNKIINEAKAAIATIIQSCETPDPELLKSFYMNSPDFVSMVGGQYAEYEQSLKNVDGYFANVASQKSTIRNEKYVVLDISTVLYTADSSWEVNLKNDTSFIMDPAGMQFLLKKIGDEWKVLSWTEEAIMKQ